MNEEPARLTITCLCEIFLLFRHGRMTQNFKPLTYFFSIITVAHSSAHLDFLYQALILNAHTYNVLLSGYLGKRTRCVLLKLLLRYAVVSFSNCCELM